MNLILHQVNGFSGIVAFDGTEIKVVLGNAGLTEHKVEGDNATPAGLLTFRRVFYRPDRVKPPQSFLNVTALTPEDGWCDDPKDKEYNKFIHLPFAASHENLWREDYLYDLIVVLGWNDDPIVPGKGSAIFLHLPPKKGGTAGCIAMEEEYIRKILSAGVTGIVCKPSQS